MRPKVTQVAAYKASKTLTARVLMPTEEASTLWSGGLPASEFGSSIDRTSQPTFPLISLILRHRILKDGASRSPTSRTRTVISITTSRTKASSPTSTYAERGPAMQVCTATKTFVLGSVRTFSEQRAGVRHGLLGMEKLPCIHSE